MTFVFSLDPGLETPSGIFLLAEQFFNTRESAARRGSARSDRFCGAIEVVPSQGLHVGSEDEVGMAFPDLKLMLLSRVHRQAHDLENVCGGAAVAVLHADGDTDYRGSAEVAGGARRNGSDERAVSETARADLDRFEQARKGATRADGVHQIALRENHGFAGSQVRRHHPNNNPYISKPPRFENPFTQTLQ